MGNLLERIKSVGTGIGNEFLCIGDDGVKISRITLNNYRSFNNITIDLNGDSVVIFGENGVGKSSVLHAINLLFIRILYSIVQEKTKPTIYIQTGDIKNGGDECNIEVDFDIAGKSYSFARNIKRDGHGEYKRKNLESIVREFRSDFLESDSSNMPIFVNYGIHRLVLDIPLRIRQRHIFDKRSALTKAIDNKIDFRTFFEWFRYQEDLENEIIIEKKDFMYRDRALQAVRESVQAMLDYAGDLHIERHPLTMVIKKDGERIAVNQLSDGEKCTLALFGDLSRRLALANPSLENPNHGKGIVLIDEVELHMHPRWQRRIIPVLKRTFPNIQFIITTHSPQVLGEVGDGFKIYSMQKDGNDVILGELPRLDGWDSNEILETLMRTAHINKETERCFEQIFDCLENGDYEEAKKHLDSIQNRMSGKNPKLLRAKMILQMEALGYDIHKKNSRD